MPLRIKEQKRYTKIISHSPAIKDTKALYTSHIPKIRTPTMRVVINTFKINSLIFEVVWDGSNWLGD